MKGRKLIVAILCAFLLCGCENFVESDEINGIVKKNDLSIVMRMNGDTEHNGTVEKVIENQETGGYYLKIDVAGEFDLRGKADIEPGRKYRLTVTLRNESADPLIHYSFWESPVTSKRYFVLGGRGGNPPESATQEIREDWITFQETFEAEGEEKSFMLSLHSGKGIFYLKEIRIEELND